MSDEISKSAMMARAARTGQQVDLRRLQQQAAANEAAQIDTTIWLPLDRITLDERIQVRVSPNRETIERYGTIMAENGSYEPFPPVVVFREGETYWLSAGFTRTGGVMYADELLIAEGKAPIGGVRAESRSGTWLDAYWFAITDNLKNGLQLSSIDLKEALRRLLGYDVETPAAEEYITKSNRQLAAILGVSHTTIKNWRRELEQNARSGGNKFPPAQTLRQGVDGKVYNVSNIQDANEQRATPSAHRANGYDYDQTPDYEEPVIDFDASEPAGRWDDPPAPPPASRGREPKPHVSGEEAKLKVLFLLSQIAALLHELNMDDDAGQFDNYADSLRKEWRIRG